MAPSVSRALWQPTYSSRVRLIQLVNGHNEVKPIKKMKIPPATCRIVGRCDAGRAAIVVENRRFLVCHQDRPLPGKTV